MTGKTWNGNLYLYPPFINIYAFCFLVGGAVVSAIKYFRNNKYRHYMGNIFIAFGGLLPGIGGSFTKFGYIEVLYVTELLGIILIYSGYLVHRNEKHRKITAIPGLS
jgi:hypothetical protein